MTIYQNILQRGYLPKELPPSFYSDAFATYASTRSGRVALAAHHARQTATHCTEYTLALPSNEYRVLKIPHPSGFAHLVSEVAKAFPRLLKKAGVSPFSKSRPVYTTAGQRAIRPLIDPSNLSRERALSRAAASFLLRADVSQFYPSLYTHAVGWSIDPKLRARTNWQNRRLLGKRLDQALMDMQGKVSQGVPIGNDVSFLLAEIVLGQVDRELRQHCPRAVRWYDDYEIACDSRQEAEAALARLRSSLAKFNLRLNPKKTAILPLPIPSGDGWQQAVLEASRGMHATNRNMVRFFDAVFDLRSRHPDVPLLLYALGVLFRISVPTPPVLRVAESCISQALLCEPGCAQKAFAVLTFWSLNGAAIQNATILAAIERLILRHEASGTTSDLSWALAYCIERRLPLSRHAGRVLSHVHEDCVTIQSLHAHAVGLLPAGFFPRAITAELGKSSTDDQHWLALYEGVRHGFLPGLTPIVQGAPLFADMLAHRVSFYSDAVPAYAAIVHPGGAPQWVVWAWLGGLGNIPPRSPPAVPAPTGRAVDLIMDDARRVAPGSESVPDVVLRLLAHLQPPPTTPDPDTSPYS